MIWVIIGEAIRKIPWSSLSSSIPSPRIWSQVIKGGTKRNHHGGKKNLILRSSRQTVNTLWCSVWKPPCVWARLMRREFCEGKKFWDQRKLGKGNTVELSRIRGPHAWRLIRITGGTWRIIYIRAEHTLDLLTQTAWEGHLSICTLETKQIKNSR